MSVHGDPAPAEEDSSAHDVDGAEGSPPPEGASASDSLSQEFVRSETHRLRRIAKELLPSDGDRDDLVQDVWLEALEHPPRSKGRLSAWLRVVTNHAAHRFWRRSRSRTDRERLAAKSEAEPSVLDALEREAARAELRKWIEDLRPPYREVLLLHFFEGASPSEIAGRLQRQPATVRSQLRRGLEQLRARYDAGGDRALGVGPWLAALLAEKAGRPGAGGVRRASILRATSIAAGLLALTAVVLWIERVRSHDRLALRPPGLDRLSSSSDEGGAETPATADRDDTRRSALEAGATTAPSVVASATDSVPAATSEPSPPPAYAVAGRTTDILGSTVADAEIWIASTEDPAEARLVARSDASGNYSIPLVSGDVWIWAEEIDNGVSRRQHVFQADAEETVERDIAFDSNLGRLKGVVRDPRGAPVAGALVRCAYQRPGRGARGDADSVELVRGTPRTSDERGRFEITRIQVPSVHVLVIAPGEAPFALRTEGKCRKPLDIALPAAAELSGAILEPDGAPAAGIEVLLEHPDPLPAARATTEADGTFRFERVPPGPFRLTATGNGASSLSSSVERGELRPGESRGLAPARLSEGWTIRGAARAGGTPLADWTVTLAEDEGQSAGDRERRTRTASDGTFAFTGCGGESYALAIRAPGTLRGSKLAEIRSVQPGGSPAVLEFDERSAPAAKLRGTLAEARVPAGDAVVVVARRTFGTGTDPAVVEAIVDRRTGAFEIGPLAAGEYAVEAKHPVLGRLDLARGVALGPGASTDLGHLAPPRRGTLVVRWSQGFGTGRETFAVTLSGDHLFLAGRRQNPGTRMQFDEAAREVRIADLMPGEYTLILHGASVAIDLRTVRILEDATCTVDVPLREGAPAEIRVTGTRPFEPDESVVVTVHAVDRTFEFPLREENRTDDLNALLRFRVTFPDGTNRIEVATSGGLRGERVFEAKGHVPFGTVEIPLR